MVSLPISMDIAGVVQSVGVPDIVGEATEICRRGYGEAASNGFRFAQDGRASNGEARGTEGTRCSSIGGRDARPTIGQGAGVAMGIVRR